VAERAVPQAAEAAQLRSKFPTWSPETVVRVRPRLRGSLRLGLALA